MVRDPHRGLSRLERVRRGVVDLDRVTLLPRHPETGQDLPDPLRRDAVRPDDAHTEGTASSRKFSGVNMSVSIDWPSQWGRQPYRSKSTFSRCRAITSFGIGYR